jgi:outer membrane receptor for ferric coprogen and ferric-rhodotorulic acid
VYAAAQFSLHDNLTLILGNRVSSFTVDTPTQNDVTKHSGVNTPYAGLVYDLMDNVSIYTSYTEIFLPQNARDVNNKRLDPTQGSNIEFGVKGDFLNEKLTASVALYKVEEDNVAAPDPVNTGLLPDGTLPSIGIKGAKTRGYEIELNGKPSDALTVFLSYTYNDAERADGSPLSPFLPESMMRASALYDVNDKTRFGLNINWQSDISLPAAGPNGETFEQGSYAVVSLMGSYEISNDWKLNANINNVLDEKYFSSIDFFNQGFFGAPRNVEVSVRYSW